MEGESTWAHRVDAWMKNQTSHARHHTGLILALAGLMSSVTLMAGSVRVAYAQAVAPSWGCTMVCSFTTIPSGRLTETGCFSIASGRKAETSG